jgi:hypothetical protein
LRYKSSEWKNYAPFVPAALMDVSDVIDDKSCVTVIVNTFVVLLNLSVAVPIAVELFVGTSFDPINIAAEKS